MSLSKFSESFGNFQNLMGDNLVLSEFIKIFKDFDCSGGYKSFIIKLLRTGSWVIGILFFDYILKNKNDVFNKIKEYIKKILWICISKTLYIKTIHKSTTGRHDNNIYTALKATEDNYFSIYVEDCGSNTKVMYRLKRIHDNFYNNLLTSTIPVPTTPPVPTSVKIVCKYWEYSTSINSTATTTSNTTANKPAYYEEKAHILYPSKNYIHLHECIEDYIDRSTLDQNFYPLGILIDGEPGLGKTEFSKYIATQNIGKSVV